MATADRYLAYTRGPGWVDLDRSVFYPPHVNEKSHAASRLAASALYFIPLSFRREPKCCQKLHGRIERKKSKDRTAAPHTEVRTSPARLIS
jgi:hypothetical protein